MTSPPYVVLADDLTGVLDAGVQFARAGLRVRLALPSGRDALPTAAALAGTDVALWTTESRALPASAAAEQVRQTARRLSQGGCERAYKKIDSTLRGHPGAELLAAAEVWPPVAIVAPSYPAQGRVVIDGRLYVRGVPLSESPFAHDPVAPARDDRLPHVLAEHSRAPVAHVRLEDIERGTHVLAAHLRAAAGQGVKLIGCDATEDRHLATIAAAAAAAGLHSLLAGSAGLAAHMPAILGLKPTHRVSSCPRADRVLVVAGSQHPATHQQVEEAIAKGGWSRFGLRASHAGDSLPAEPVVRRLSAEVASTLADPQTTAVLAVDAPQGAVHPHRILAALEAIAAAVVQQAVARRWRLGLVLTGGDTAMAVLRSVGARTVVLVDEVLPGLPRSIVRPTRGNLRWPVVTKAGGFGPPDALLACEAALRGAVV